MLHRSWASTDIGTVRAHNEDAVLARDDAGLWAVADGAGGHSAGEVASGMLRDALAAIPANLPGGAMLNAVRTDVAAVHEALLAEAQRRGPDTIIASTLVVLMIRDGSFACLWAGDSRAYLLRDGALQQITRDHTLVQELVDAGTITAAEAEMHPQANVIIRAIGGGEADQTLDKVSGALAPGDRFLLCSDGISKALDDALLARLLAEPAPDPSRRVIEAALAAHARDNISAVVVDVLGAAR